MSYYERNREKLLEQSNAYYHNNKKEVQERNAANKEHRKAYNRKYYLERQRVQRPKAKPIQPHVKSPGKEDIRRCPCGELYRVKSKSIHVRNAHHIDWVDKAFAFERGEYFVLDSYCNNVKPRTLHANQQRLETQHTEQRKQRTKATKTEQ